MVVVMLTQMREDVDKGDDHFYHHKQHQYHQNHHRHYQINHHYRQSQTARLLPLTAHCQF